jgi:hypothetical protein
MSRGPQATNGVPHRLTVVQVPNQRNPSAAEPVHVALQGLSPSRRDTVCTPSGPTGRAVTAQGHPRAIFSRAIERGNLTLAEQVAREVPNLTLEEALRLLFLYAEEDPLRYEKAALRWLDLYLAKGKAVSLLKMNLASAALVELRGVEREHAARLTVGVPRGEAHSAGGWGGHRAGRSVRQLDATCWSALMIASRAVTPLPRTAPPLPLALSVQTHSWRSCPRSIAPVELESGGRSGAPQVARGGVSIDLYDRRLGVSLCSPRTHHTRQRSPSVLGLSFDRLLGFQEVADASGGRRNAGRQRRRVEDSGWTGSQTSARSVTSSPRVRSAIGTRPFRS